MERPRIGPDLDAHALPQSTRPLKPCQSGDGGVLSVFSAFYDCLFSYTPSRTRPPIVYFGRTASAFATLTIVVIPSSKLIISCLPTPRVPYLACFRPSPSIVQQTLGCERLMHSFSTVLISSTWMWTLASRGRRKSRLRWTRQCCLVWHLSCPTWSASSCGASCRAACHSIRSRA